MTLVPGQTLQARYTIQALLGQGGMGAVYLARDVRLGCLVAVKENTAGDPFQFQQEAMILANLYHPNLPRVSDHFVEPNGAQYLVMDFIAGEDLESRLQHQGALPETQALAWFNQILDAVGYLHSRGIIHRDIKPENIKITPQSQAVLVDFGIAKVYQAGYPTLAGAKAGTPGFAAPEQYGAGTDQRSDIYSLGATLYALLTACTPPDAFGLASGSAMLVPPRALNSTISANVEQAILRAMTVVPQSRFQSIVEMKQALAPQRMTSSSSPQAGQAIRQNSPPQPVFVQPGYTPRTTSSPAKRTAGVIIVAVLTVLVILFSVIDVCLIGLVASGILGPRSTPTRGTVGPLATTAIISSITMARGTEAGTNNPVERTSVFQPNSVFHAVVAIVNAPANTKLTAAWYTVDVGTAAAAGVLIDSTDITTDGTGNVDFILTPGSKWPAGKYRVEISVNGVPAQVATFSVQ